MHCRLHRLGLVTATLLLSLTSTIKLPGIPVNWAVSAQAQTNQDRSNEAERLNNIGMGQLNTGQFREALQTFEQANGIFKALGDRKMEGTVLSNIGAVYTSLGEYPQALKYFEQALVIHKAVGNKVMEGTTLNNIGVVYNSLGQYADAEKTLFAAIEASEFLRPGLTDASKIAIFENQVDTYRFLQQALVAQNKTDTALEIAERGRARAFVELLAQRQSSNPNNQLTIKSLDLQQIQQIAKVENATLVEYSTIENQALYIWVVKPTGEVAFQQVDLKSLKTPLADLVTSSRESIGVRGRGSLGGAERADAPHQSGRLQQLHKILIEPIAQFLPTNPTDRIIFIPQNELFLVPFPALKDESGKYLIEKHTILTAPAIQVLQLTREKRQQVGARHAHWCQLKGSYPVRSQPRTSANTAENECDRKNTNTAGGVE